MAVPPTELSRFLEAAFPGATIARIAGDASTRCFFRVRPVDGTSCVVMDYGAPFEGETDDVRLSRVFQESRLPVARILRSVPQAGCLVLEDLGERTMESVLEEARLSMVPAEEGRRGFEDLYRQAVDLAVAFVVRGTPVLARSERASGPTLDAERFRFEMDFFVEHYVRGLRGIEIPPPPLVDELYHLADRAAGGSRVFCHRDFHSRNLMVRPDGSLAIVDIQDARWGPDAYDLASLLRDAYVDIPEPLVIELVNQYRAALPGCLPAAGFLARFDIVAAQRMIKALGTFAFQAKVRGQSRYLAAVPRTLDRLARLLPQRFETASLARQLERAGLVSPQSTPSTTPPS